MSKVINIIANEAGLFLEYSPDRGIDWVNSFFSESRGIRVKKTFYVSEENVFSRQTGELSDEWTGVESITFRIGDLIDNYYVIDKDILNINFDLRIYKDQTINHKYFVAEPNISVFRRIEHLGLEQLTIGGDYEGAIPAEVFKGLIKNFPTHTELTKYALARISSVLRDYIETDRDAVSELSDYINRRVQKKGKITPTGLIAYEIDKFSALQFKLKTMLDKEDVYPEKVWQDEILEIIRLMYPKYIHAFKEVPLKDSYTKTTRKVDIMLVDAAGYVDIIEIKKPFQSCIMSLSRYRDNHIPLRDLSGTVMQIEKYILHFNKWGIDGERDLSIRYSKILPPNFSIKITNPHGIIIMGRSNNLSSDQKFDFELLKRKYKNIVDIITYDDLIARLECILQQLENNQFVTLA